MADCQYPGCGADIPLSGGGINPKTGYRQPFHQRKYCEVHRPLIHAENGRRARWRPDRYEDRDGYVLIMTEQGRRAEHRVIMEAALGRPLRKGESVHHRNGVRNDNRPENLELWIGSIRYGQRATDITCPGCGHAYWDELTGNGC